jgi:hypothetical protein
VRQRYDESNPDPQYHAEWSRRLADRAVFASRVSIGFAVVAVALNVLVLLGVFE